jgi:hypothetical protein
MATIVLNKREYTDNGCFERQHIEEYCNLSIYPLVGILEREAGLLNEFSPQNIIVIHGNTPLESIEFLKDNLIYETLNDIKITYIHESVKRFELIKLNDVMFCLENEYFNGLFEKKIKVRGLSKILYLNEKAFKIFQETFHWYFENNEFFYDNLICYTMIVKNAGSMLEQVLIDNLPIIDRWCILDTGSTDGTQELIKRVLANKKGTLYEEPFVDFKVSRNRCLELAGKTCKFIVMLDDTYSIRGDLRGFLTTVRGDQFSDTFSLLIQSDDSEYYSNRIIKSQTGLRYIHRIHEVINNENNVNVTIPSNRSVIFDNRAEYMEKRTMDRKQFDLELLFKELEEFPDDPRSLYYIAQTYGCIGDEANKAKYLDLRINHPVEGYVQEKIDSYFELARCYNFKIDSFTHLPLRQELTDSQWKICEDLYISAFNLDKNRPDSLYFIGIHYYLNGQKDIAYSYMKQAFEIGYPINSQYSLKPTLTFHFLPKFLAELCYYFKDFTTGKSACELFLTSSKYNAPGKDSWNTMINWYKIHENLKRMPLIQEIPRTLDLPIFCFVTDGGWEPWTGSDILKKGLGGSETWIIETARNVSLTGLYHVVVFCKTLKPEFFYNVGYNPVELFHDFIATTRVQHLIVSRYTEYVPVALLGHSENVHIIFHDNLQPETIIPIDGLIKNLFGLTDWHANNIKRSFPQFKIDYNNYGVDQELFNGNIKTKNSFIYSSFPNRGLIVVLRMWPKIIKEFPDATLNIYCNLEQEWVNTNYPEMMDQIRKLLKINRTGIKVHGWVSKSELAEAWNTSEYFLYPCIFEETFCLTALEAAISQTCIISNGLAALSETAKHGITVEGNPLLPEWEIRCFEKLKHIMVSDNYKRSIVEKNYQWAQTLTWKSQTEKLLLKL